jgi:hypothetical protein
LCAISKKLFHIPAFSISLMAGFSKGIDFSDLNSTKNGAETGMALYNEVSFEKVILSLEK